MKKATATEQDPSRVDMRDVYKKELCVLRERDQELVRESRKAARVMKRAYAQADRDMRAAKRLASRTFSQEMKAYITESRQITRRIRIIEGRMAS